MKHRSKSKFFQFTILKPGYYLDALLFWSIYTSSTMLILWLLTSTAKNQLRETLATQFVNSARQMVDVLDQQGSLSDSSTKSYLKTITGSYPEIAGLAIVSWSPGQPVRILNSHSTKKIDFGEQVHEAFLSRTAVSRQLTISDWPIFTKEAASFLTPPSRAVEFIYAKIKASQSSGSGSGVFLVTAYDADMIQHGFYKVEESGITAVCISILLGTVFAIFVRFRSAQRLEVTEEKTRALDALRRRDMALSRVVEAADLLLGPNEVDKVFSGLLEKMAQGWEVPLMTALLKNSSNEVVPTSRDYRFVGTVPAGDYPEAFSEFSEKFPQFWERIEKGEVLMFSRRDSPSAIRIWMRQNQMSQIAATGLIQESGVMGLMVVGAGEVSALEEVGIVEMLKLTADIFSAAYQQREQEEWIRESSKMEALGRVAGGVAHEFNNLLHIIIGNLKSGEKGMGADRVARIAEAAERGSRIVDQLLEATRLHAPDLKSGSLNRLAEQTLALAQSGVGSGIELKADLAPGLPETLMDEGQIHQVILNLLLNACDACPQGGKINVRTGRAGNRLFCEVRDNGPGIAKADLERLFEPFFTTKAPGKGTGLGLSTSRGILERHEGTIEGGNAEGGGAFFRFFLPIRQDRDSVESNDLPDKMVEWEHSGGPVWIVDDEELCRHVLRECFEDRGVPVVEFENGSRLVEHLEKTGDQPGWIITDYTMPGLHGRELVRRLREMCPRSVLIVTSGFVLQVEEMPEVQGFVTKPFTPEELFAALAAVEED